MPGGGLATEHFLNMQTCFETVGKMAALMSGPPQKDQMSEDELNKIDQYALTSPLGCSVLSHTFFFNPTTHFSWNIGLHPSILRAENAYGPCVGFRGILLYSESLCTRDKSNHTRPIQIFFSFHY